MDEETKSPKVIKPLTDEEFKWLHRALQWPEDLPQYDKIAKPTKLNELPF